MTLQISSKPSQDHGTWRRASLADIAYEAILEAIVDLTLTPRSRVNMDALAAELNMSNTPIREALARLTTTGLVQQISNRGFIVAPFLSISEYHHLFDVRCLLETNALRAAHFSTEDLEALDELAQAISAMEYGTTYKHFIGNLHVDESFHLRLIQASMNRFYVDAWRSLNFYSHVSRLHTQTEALDNDSYKNSLADHVEIVQLLRDEQREQAVEKLHAHIRSVEVRLISSAEKLAALEEDQA
ncbi:MAG: GntR family transcriptional regulator [Chloroflexota bacterium]